MAYIARQTTQEFAAAATATPTLLAHAADDVIFFVVTQDGGGTAISITVATGWTVYDPGAASGGCRQVVSYKKAASGSETAPVFNGANDEWIIQQFIVKDVDTSTAMDFTPVSSGWNLVSSKISPAATVATAGTLLLFSWGADGAQQMRHKLSEAVMLDSYRESTNAISSLVSYYQQVGTGAAQQATMYAINANEGGHTWVVGFRNKSGGSLAPMPLVSATELRWYGDYGATHDATTTWTNAADITGAGTISGLAVSNANPTVSTATQNSAPNGKNTSLSHNTNLGAAAWIGGSHGCSSVDMAGKVLALQWEVSGINSTVLGSKGAIIILGDAAGGWIAYQLSPASGLAALYAYFSQIAVGQATALDSSSFDITQVTKIGFAYHRLSGVTTAIDIRVKNLTLMDSVTFRSGGASSPCSASLLANALNGEFFYQQAENLGGNMTLAKCDLNIGDGTNATYWDGGATALAFPPAYNSRTNKFVNIDPLALTITINAASGDTINNNAALISANQSQYYTIDAGSDLAAAVTHAGASVVGFVVADNAGETWANATLADGGTATFAGGADLTDCAITGTTSTNAAMAVTADGTVLTRQTIEIGAAAYHLELGTSVTAITLADVTFSGSGTDKVHVLKTTGTVTITISGTTSLVAGDVTSAGATVVIAAPNPTLDAAVLANTRALLWNRTTSAELDNTFVAGTSWSKTITSGASSGDVLDLYAFKEGYAESVATIIYSGTDATFAIEQEVDPAIDYYRTQESITDYTTLTEYDFYSPDIYIQADDSDGENTLKKLFIFYNGVLTTADGATYMRGGITFRSAFDVVINRSVRAIAVDNVSVTHGLHFTDEDVIRVTTDDGTSWIAPPSAPGSIRYAFGVSPGQIETTGSSVITGDISTVMTGISNVPAAVLSAATSTPIAANVKEVNDYAISGAGTESDPWGP